MLPLKGLNCIILYNFSNVMITDVFYIFSASQMEDGSVQRDCRKIQTLAQVTEELLYFTRSQLDILVSFPHRNTITPLFL